MSGMIIEARDHVLITTFCCERPAASTRLASFGCTYGPFFVDLDTSSYFLPRRFTIIELLGFFLLRVR